MRVAHVRGRWETKFIFLFFYYSISLVAVIILLYYGSETKIETKGGRMDSQTCGETEIALNRGGKNVARLAGPAENRYGV